MRGAGWTVQACETKVDLAITQDCNPDDVVISADSDMLAYLTISTLWHQVSRNLILAYELEDVHCILSFTKAQLMALVVVSRNDYRKNIYSLGLATNHSIIKTIQSKGNLSIINNM